MKTFTRTKVETLPRLIIRSDENSESPRKNCDNLGYFFTNERDYHSPDGNASDLYQIMIETADEAENVNDHVQRMTSRINDETDEKVLAIYPVNRFEHGNVVYRLGVGKGFDVSNSGFYIVTEKTAELLGVSKKEFEETIKQELEVYTKWCNGEVYEFELFDEKGNLIDECGALYSLDEVKDCLPYKDWKDEDMIDYVNR